MKAAASLFVSCLLLSLVLVWQVGCNPDVGLDDPIRPKADLQVLKFTPGIVQPTEVKTGGTESTTSADGLSQTTKPVTSVIFPEPTVEVRTNNNVPVLITGYTVVYTFVRTGNPNTGLAVFGGPLNVFVEGATFQSTLGGSTAGGGTSGGSTGGASAGGGSTGGTSGGGGTEGETSGGTTAATGRATFTIDALSSEAEDLLVGNTNMMVANITFFCEDVNGHRFTVTAQLSIDPRVLVSQSGGSSGGSGQ